MVNETQTRLLIPAPSDTRSEGQIDWYEARIDRRAKSVHLVAFNGSAQEVARAEVQLSGRNGVNDGVRVVMADERSVDVDFSLARRGAEDFELRGAINNRDFEMLSEKVANAESVRVTKMPDLDAAEADVLSRWGRLGDSLLSLARATQATSGEAHHSWGCSSCLLGAAGTGLAAGACIATLGLAAAGGACAAALLGAAAVSGECGGAADPCG